MRDLDVGLVLVADDQRDAALQSDGDILGGSAMPDPRD